MEGEEILRFFPDRLKCAMENAVPDWQEAEEIRLRAKKPVFFYMGSREYILHKKGFLLPSSERKESKEQRESKRQETKEYYMVGAEDIRTILDKISGYSLYAYEDELRQGYFTLEGGHRVGIAGKTVVQEGKITAMKYLSFLNIRISHEKKGCGRAVAPKLLRGGVPLHTLLLSPPGCGKTTLLRDLVRLFSDGFFYMDKAGRRQHFFGITAGVADERNEISACVRGIPSADLGMRTDVLSGCPKSKGIFMLLRSMGPKLIAADEIGNAGDFEAVFQAVNSGCTIFATAHGASIRELSEKPRFASFMEENIFERYVVLSGREGKGTVEGIYDREGGIL